MSARCRTDGDQDETRSSGANVPSRVGCHGDGMPGPEGHVLAIDNDDAGPADYGVYTYMLRLAKRAAAARKAN